MVSVGVLCSKDWWEGRTPHNGPFRQPERSLAETIITPSMLKRSYLHRPCTPTPYLSQCPHALLFPSLPTALAPAPRKLRRRGQGYPFWLSPPKSCLLSCPVSTGPLAEVDTMVAFCYLSRKTDFFFFFLKKTVESCLKTI